MFFLYQSYYVPAINMKEGELMIFPSRSLSLQSRPPPPPHCHHWTRHNLTSIVLAVPDSLLCLCLLWANKCVTIWVVSEKLLSFIWRRFLTRSRLGKRGRTSLLRLDIDIVCQSGIQRQDTKENSRTGGARDPPCSDSDECCIPGWRLLIHKSASLLNSICLVHLTWHTTIWLPQLYFLTPVREQVRLM